MVVKGSMKGFVVVNDRGHIQGGTLEYSAAGARERFTSAFDAAEPYFHWDHWKARGFAAVRCEVFAAVNHKRRRAPRS